jgi:hypothetical protein
MPRPPCAHALILFRPSRFSTNCWCTTYGHLKLMDSYFESAPGAVLPVENDGMLRRRRVQFGSCGQSSLTQPREVDPGNLYPLVFGRALSLLARFGRPGKHSGPEHKIVGIAWRYSFFLRRIAQSSQPGDFGEVHSGPRAGGRGIFSPVNALNQLASYAPGSSLTVTVSSFGR